MKKRSLKIMSVVLAGVMTTGMILGGCSAGGDKENGGSERSVAKISRSRYGGKSNRYETHYCKGDIPYFAVESGWGYVVSENSKNKDTAWDFVKYCMEPENAKEFNLGTGTVASLKAIIDDEGYQSDERNVRVSDQYQYLQYARSVGPVQDMDFVKKTLLDTFTKAASGSIGTDEALEEMETSINNHIQELLKQAK